MFKITKGGSQADGVGMDGSRPPHSDAELRAMGVVFYNPKLLPVRKTVEVDGRKCLVGCRPRAFASQRYTAKALGIHAIYDPIGSVMRLLQVFLSEGDRQRKMGECREEVEANCRGGARSV